MARRPKNAIDEELLSGYLDGALPQAEAQRVRILLEDDPDSRALYEDLKTLRETASSTQFVEAPDDAWPEWPRTKGSWLTRSLGWVVLIAWFLVVTAFALYKLFTQTGDPLEIFLVLGMPGGFVLLLLSVLIDRIRDLTTDRYRGIHR